MSTKGRLTLPSENNFYEETKELIERWGADAIRDSDGTKLDDDLKDLPVKIYTTYFVARHHNDFIKDHMEEVQHLYLMSNFNTAQADSLTIEIMTGYFDQQIQPNNDYDPRTWWEVIDRTTDQVVDPADWTYDSDTQTVTIENTVPFHEYTVSFLANKIWDPTQMYNHITNNWGDEVPHDIPFDVRQPASNQYMSEYLDQWCQDNPKTDVVRFTTFFYHFTLFFNDLGKEKFVDWFGYGASVSPEALEAFEQEKGYRLCPEDFVDEGYYNSSFRVPNQRYLDYMDFTMRFVAKEAKKLVDIVHSYDKEAMMFLGDNWIGTEPYGPYFKEIGLDAVVGSVGGGATLRMIADIPHVKYTEGRFLPYFFPDTFYEGNDPMIEAVDNWISARRAIMRSPVDRIGYGGYPSLAYKFPDFVSYIEKVADEFRELYSKIKGTQAYSGLKVGILNAWGSLRTWQTHMVAHALSYKQIYSYLGVLEALSGAAVDVSFISFDDVLETDVLDDLDVVINAGDHGTSFSGGHHWDNEKLVAKLRAYVFNGGGFVGIGQPTAYLKGGHYYQLAQVMGVDEELGFSLSTDKYFTEPLENHYITQDLPEGHVIDFGESQENVYALFKDTEIIEYSNDEVHLAAHSYGAGRGVYIAGLPYSFENTRLLLRALYYAANKEDKFYQWQSTNIYVEVNAYPEIGEYALVNNTNQAQVTTIYTENDKYETTLEPGEIRWELIQ